MSKLMQVQRERLRLDGIGRHIATLEGDAIVFEEAAIPGINLAKLLPRWARAHNRRQGPRCRFTFRVEVQLLE